MSVTLYHLQQMGIQDQSRKADGSEVKFKEHLIAKGFEQKCGLDYYTKTFSPVFKPFTLRLLLALPVQFEWHIRLLD